MQTTEAVSGFILSCSARNLSPRSIEFYQWALRDLPDQVPELPADVEAVECFMASRRGAPATKRAYHRGLKAFFNWFAERKKVPTPMSEIRRPKGHDPDPYILTEAEITRLLASCPSRRDRAMACVFLDTGARCSEIARLRWADVRANSHRVDGERVSTIEVSGKTGMRELFISPATLAQLKGLGTEYVFESRLGGPLTRQGVGLAIRKAMRRAGIRARKIGPHTLRHTFGTHYIDNGGDEFSLQEILGHTNLATTRRYVHLARNRVFAKHARFGPLVRILEGLSEDAQDAPGPTRLAASKERYGKRPK